MLIVAERVKNFKKITRVVDKRENSPLRVENGKREKWRETHDRVVFFPFAFAVNAMLNLSSYDLAMPGQFPYQLSYQADGAVQILVRIETIVSAYGDSLTKKEMVLHVKCGENILSDRSL